MEMTDEGTFVIIFCIVLISWFSLISSIKLDLILGKLNDILSNLNKEKEHSAERKDNE